MTTYATVRVWQRGDVDEAPRVEAADAIVVLGAAQYDGRPSPVFRARLDHAIGLWKAGTRPLLVMTGGGLRGRPDDGGRDRPRLRDRAGRAPRTPSSWRTAAARRQESLEAVADILEGEGAGATIFVSDRLHMLRVMRMAKDLGIDAYGSPATDSPSDATLERRLDATLHELGALAWYGLVGRPVPERRAATARS